MPKPPLVFNSLKRKRYLIILFCYSRVVHSLSFSAEITSSQSKKAKKAMQKSAAAAAATNSNSYGMDFNDQAALNRRAERFQREHDLEKMKSIQIGGGAHNKANSQQAHFLPRSLSSRTGSSNTSNDEPEGDPVCQLKHYNYTEWLTQILGIERH